MRPYHINADLFNLTCSPYFNIRYGSTTHTCINLINYSIRYIIESWSNREQNSISPKGHAGIVFGRLTLVIKRTLLIRSLNPSKHSCVKSYALIR